MDYSSSLHITNLEEIVAWYQKKIGTYDKQEWEKTVEQKILNSFTNITLKSAKLKTEFIDVDLVRGSSFPKAKPKQSLLTVIRLAILRYLFLPIYKEWWVSHTSSKLYIIFLILYIGQIIGWFIYITNYSRNDINNEHIVSVSELIIPMIISFILCLIHSLIVSTNSINNSNSKNKQLFNKNGKVREKIRRRKKIVRNVMHVEIIDSNELLNKKTGDDSIGNLDNNNTKGSSSIIKNSIKLEEQQEGKPAEIKEKRKDKLLINQTINNDNVIKIEKNAKVQVFNQQNVMIHNSRYDLIDISNRKNYNVQNKTLLDNFQSEEDCSNNSSNIKKRNVNWDSPIHNYGNNNSDINNGSNIITNITNSKLNKKQISNDRIFNIKLLPNYSTNPSTSKIFLEKTEILPIKTNTTATININNDTSNNKNNINNELSSTSSSISTSVSSDMNSKNQNDIISSNTTTNCNSNSHNNNNNSSSSNSSSISNHIMNTTTNSTTSSINTNDNIKNLLEPLNKDDGFESLNGKSSSGEDNKLDDNNVYMNCDLQQQEFNYNKKIEIILKNNHKNNQNSHSNSSYSSSNENTPLVQSKNQRQKIKFGKNRINSPDHNINDNNDDDDDDELSDEELFKSNFDKLNKRYSIPLVRNSRRKLTTNEFELNNRSSVMNLQNNTCIKSTTDTTNSIIHKTLLSSTGETSSIGGMNRSNESSDIDEDGDDEEVIVTNQNSLNRGGVYNGCLTAGTEWFGITTNSEECSYSSEPNSDLKEDSDEISDHESAPNVLLNSRGSNDIISCTMWHRHDPKKAEMSVLDISSCIIERVEAMPESSDYIYIGVVCSIILSLIPSLCRLCDATVNWETSTEVSYFDVPLLLWEKTSFSLSVLIELTFGKTFWERIILINGFFERLILTSLLFFLFAVAERTFKQRFLYAKLFSHLTSSRRARKSDLPHFRLNKVRNIKTWLSVRSYLKRRGPQRSVDVIVSTALSIALILLGFLSVECLKDSVHIHSQLNLEALFWSGALGIYLLRFMTLGNKINRKYRSISVLITEQINLYLQIEQKPKKKDELMVANSVLKLAADLLKELESPFKISGLCANPYLYTTIKVIILSAFSGVLSEMLGFKLKLHKIKIK